VVILETIHSSTLSDRIDMIRPTHMKAAILTEQRRPLEIAEVTVPDTLDVGQVLVKIVYSGICGSQIGEIDGVKGADRFLPHLLGHEGSGVVVEVGPGVHHVQCGDKVVLHWRKGQGIESTCPQFPWKEHTVNAGWVTTFNEYAIVSENRLTAVPPDCDMKVAALLGCAVLTGFGVIENDAKVRMGESVIVYGAGGVGLNIVQAAVLVSAHPIIAVDVHNEKLELAKGLGATHVINSSDGNARDTLLDIVGSAGADVFIDNTGKPAIIEMGYQITSAVGRVILVGVPHQGDEIKIYSLPLHFGKVLSGSCGGQAMPHCDIPRYMGLVHAGRVRLKALITNMYSLDHINDAIDDMRNGRIAGRCLIHMEDEA
jgi:S-(hydroxymethyl)glutathione dehydrogenase / alcohol dehydrogenase